MAVALIVSRLVAFVAATVIASAALAAPDASLPPRLKPLASPVVRAESRPATAAATVRSLPPRLRPGTRGKPSAGGGNAAAQIVAVSRTGALCGDRAIRGEVLRPISDGPSCAIAAPVRVRSIDGVAFDQPAIMTCETARATRDWLREGAVPAWGRLGRGLGQITVSTSFSCAPVGGEPRSQAPEHAGGQAIDISGFTLKNGLKVAVGPGWRDPVAGRVLRKLAASACGPFQTVASPEAGQGGRDLLHLATDPGRRRPQCR